MELNRDLTPEGERILDNVLTFDHLQSLFPDGSYQPPTPPVTARPKSEVDLSNMKLELIKMIINSKMVVRDCEEILYKLDNVEAYMLNDTKIAKTIHLNLIDRLERVLLGMTAFQDESHIRVDVSKYRRYLTSK